MNRPTNLGNEAVALFTPEINSIFAEPAHHTLPLFHFNHNRTGSSFNYSDIEYSRVQPRPDPFSIPVFTTRIFGYGSIMRLEAQRHNAFGP